MDGAGSDDDKETMRGIGILDDGNGGITGVDDRLPALRRLRDFMLKQVWRSEGVVTAHYDHA